MKKIMFQIDYLLEVFIMSVVQEDYLMQVDSCLQPHQSWILLGYLEIASVVAIVTATAAQYSQYLMVATAKMLMVKQDHLYYFLLGSTLQLLTESIVTVKVIHYYLFIKLFLRAAMIIGLFKQLRGQFRFSQLFTLMQFAGVMMEEQYSITGKFHQHDFLKLTKE